MELWALLGGVSRVKECMQVDFLGAALGGQFGHCDQVVLVAVHAAVGKQAEDVHCLAGPDGLVHGFADRRIAEEIAVTDGFGDAREVLIHHPAGAKVHVADLGVAHLAIRQPDVHAATGDQAVRLRGEQAIVDRGVGGMDGIEVRAVAVSEAVENDQYQGFGCGRHRVRAPWRRAKKGDQSTVWTVAGHD